MGFRNGGRVPLFATTGLSLVARAWMSSLRSLATACQRGCRDRAVSRSRNLVLEEKFATLHSGEGELIVGGSSAIR